jgi:hypothetical protein
MSRDTRKQPRKPRIQPIVTQPQQHLAVPSEVRRRGAPLLNQQCWCWGWDIRRAEGNLLIEYGFARHRVPEGVRGSSMYERQLDHGRLVVLWGFGLFYGDPALGGLFLRREGFNPQCTGWSALQNPIWEVEKMAAHAPATADGWRCLNALTAAALRWIADYEQWVGNTLGNDYRATCVAHWRKKPISAGEMSIE